MSLRFICFYGEQQQSEMVETVEKLCYQNLITLKFHDLP
jgi:hypothetical protein